MLKRDMPKVRLPLRAWLAPAVALALAVLGGLAVFGRGPVARDAAARWAVAQFDAPAIGTDALAEMLATAAPPLLVDARTAAETDVSRIPGAITWEEEAGAEPPPEVAQAVRDGRTVVVYCSIGYRSGRAATRLARLEPDAENPSVYNLQGGIFQWAVEGRPLEGSDRVHPYSAAWGRLLPARLRAQVDRVD